MTWLITADLHLSDRPRDAYRFGLFKWLAKQQQKHNVTATFLLGDITDSKDRHASRLVNRVVDGMTSLKPPVYNLLGNHDYIDLNNPFFKFLNCIDGLEFLTEPTFLKGFGVGLVPHCKGQAEFDRSIGMMPPKLDALMVHATFTGAQAETGARLTGLSASPIEFLQPRACWAGDVHKPQRCGPVTYVGAPYHVRFGDTYTPRVLLVKNGKEQNLHFDAPRKWSLQIKDHEELLHNKNLQRGDQVKIIYELTREEVVEWSRHKQASLDVCKELGVEVFGVDLKVNTGRKHKRLRLERSQAATAEDVVGAFCKNENVAGNIRSAGLAIIKE